MTAQIPEVLIYNNEELHLHAEPLKYWLDANGRVRWPPSLVSSSACWRGYEGYWEIVATKLFLTKIEVLGDESRNNVLGSLFPNSDGMVFAEWVTGELRATRGELVEYVHGGFPSPFVEDRNFDFEEDIFFDIEKGVLKKVSIRKNHSR